MKLLMLSRGMFSKVDDIHYHSLLSWSWCAVNSMGKYYAVGNKNGERIKLHRLLTDASCGMDVDHINGDTLDNRLENLRVCSHKNNMLNQGPRKRKISGKYKGVYFRTDKRVDPWRVILTHNGKTYHLGHFATEELGYEVYRKKAKELHGEFFKEHK